MIDVDQVQEETAGDAMEVDTREQGDKVHEEVGKGRRSKGKGKGKAKVTVEIEDNGPGVPPQDRPKIFDRFYRVDKARRRESGGAGLGLAITKWVVGAHRGEISLEGGSPQGCLFQVKLPAGG